MKSINLYFQQAHLKEDKLKDTDTLKHHKLLKDKRNRILKRSKKKMTHYVQGIFNNINSWERNAVHRADTNPSFLYKHNEIMDKRCEKMFKYVNNLKR